MELTPAVAVVEAANGIGYAANISLNTYGALQPHTGQQVKLLVHLVIREDAWILYGFTAEAERSLFRALTGVSGVGAATARIILSSNTPAELETIIASADAKALKQVKGVGAKTAERIIVDLRDKIKPTGDTLINTGLVSGQRNEEAMDEALAALVMLGFNRQQAQKALRKLFDADPLLKVEHAVRKALAMM